MADLFDEDAEGQPEEVVVELTEAEKSELLISACKVGDLVKVTELLQEHSASVGARDSRGWSPLVWAAFHGHDEVVALLLQHQADVDYTKSREDVEAAARRKQQSAAQSAAASMPHAHMASDLETDPVKVSMNSPLHWAAFKGRVQVVWQLLLHGFSPFEIDENGNNALHLAAAGGHVEVVKSLMCQGFEVDCPNGFGNDALALATDATVVSLLRRAVKQTQCPVCHKYFGGEVKRYLCVCTGEFFTEDCSEAQHIFASVEEDIRKPVRYSSRALETIQEAEAALHEAMNPRAAEAAAAAAAESAAAAAAAAEDGAAGRMGEEKVGSPSALAKLPEAAENEEKGVDGGEGVSEDPVLTRADLPNLDQALHGVRRVDGDIRLIAAAEALRARLLAQIKLEDEIEALSKRRPLSRRSDTKDLVACIASAKGQGVSPALIEQAETLSTVSLAECKLRGFIIVCKNIALATHDHDGDMNRLRGALEVCQRLGAAADLVSEAEALFAKLKTEVALFDVVNETEASWADVGRVVEECRLETESPDYSLLPRPEPIEGPDGEMVPPPSRQMLALDALRDKLAELKELADSAPDTGASDKLTQDALAAHDRLAQEWRDACVVEEERAAVEEAARVKLEKKLRKKNKKKKKKKK